MTEQALIGLVAIVGLGIAAQWLAWRLRIPSILLLLVFGLIAGPVTGFLDPDLLLGDVLFPFVSLSVAIILFEGGLNLKLLELRKIGRTVGNLVTMGALISWFVSALGGVILLGLSVPLALLFGSILVVTGPTVIMPLLRQVQPSGKVASVLKWEGIVIDPIGAVLAVLTFEAILLERAGEATTLVAIGLMKTVLAGGLTGTIGALLVILLLRRYMVPDFLHNAVSLSIALVAYVTSNYYQTESGLLAVTLMGVILVNQKWVAVQHILQFKENLRVLLISSLFILLGARLRTEHLGLLGWGSLAFLILIIFVGRPASVMVSSIGKDLDWRERVFLSSVAPRGIVAAAVSSVLALRLAEAGFEQAERLVPLTFMVIIGTVTIYGLTASPVARRLKIASPYAQGFLVVGAHPFARAMGRVLQEEGYKVLMVDTNRANTYSARMDGLPTYYGNALGKTFLDEVNLEGIGRILAMTSNDEVNSLAVLHCDQLFDRSELYQLYPSRIVEGGIGHVPQHLQGRLLFGEGITYERLAAMFRSGAVIKRTKLKEEFSFDDFRTMYGESAVPLFLISKDRFIGVFTVDNQPVPYPGQTLISLISVG